MNLRKITAVLAMVLCLSASIEISAGNPFESLGNILSGLTSKSDFDLADLEGTWTYTSPAVTFKSDNAINKISGVAASAALENKIAPYYSRLGLNNAVVTIDKDCNFTIKLKAITLKGTVTRDEGAADGFLTFNFNAAGKIKLGKVSAMASKSGNTLTLTFDASRVISVIDKVASITKNQTITTLSNLLNTYDGIYAGARLKKH
ncbi:MAG: DUF4923 family protein [Bacteroidales bacterium]|nr:DUF4923 family protein [Bacteroidales bacterium]